MKRISQLGVHISLTIVLSFGASGVLADGAGASYAAEQCTNYNRPKPNNVRLTDADVRECCGEWAEDVEEHKQKAFIAKCTKRVNEIERQSFSSVGDKR